MAGCQGLSAGNSSQQDPGLLDFGSTSLDFGSVSTGTSQTLAITAKNTESQPITINSVAITTKYFTLTSPSLPATVAAGDTVALSLTFTPNAIGTFNATVSVSTDATNAVTNLTVTGTGTGGGQLAFSGTSGNFGNVNVGGQQSQTVTLTNNGATTVNVSQAAIGGSGFQMNGLTAPLTLTPSQSTTFTISFAPTATGVASGTVSIASDASNPVLKMGLIGTGVVAGALGPNPASLSFGTVPVGTKQTLSETLTNTGGSSITISQAAVAGSGFSMSGLTAPMTLAAGQSASFNASFQPSAPGASSGSVTITSNASNSVLTINLSGAGAQAGPITSNPASLNFGSVAVGVKQTLSATVTNTGGSSVTISQVALSGGSGFSTSGLTAPLTLTGGQSASFTVSFQPNAPGAVTGNVTITSNGSNPTLNIPLSGTGASSGPLTANPASLTFGNVQVGVNKTISETVTNTGGSSVTISQVTITGGLGFGTSGITAPVTLAGGQSATFNVSFQPPATGAVSGNLTITSNGSNPTLTISMSGTGIAAGTLGSNPTSLAFGSIQVGNSKTLSETVTNTGGSSITISQVGASGSGLSVSGISAPVTLAAGQSASFSVLFTPTVAGAVSGDVTITSTASNPMLNIPLTGTGVAAGAIGSNPTSLAFGSVPVSSSKTLSETVTNTGGSTVTISQVGVSGSGFSVSGISAPVTLTAGQSASFSVLFTPTAPGAVSGNVAITSNASNPTLNIPLTATGTASAGALVSNPTSLAFGSSAVGSTQSLSETVTNSGGISVTISQVTVSGSGFTLSGISAPVTLTAGQSASFTVSFAPTAVGAVSGNVAITSTASNPNLNIALSGTGVAAGALGSNPTSLSFGNVQIAHTNTLSETVTNTGSTSISISQVAVSGTGFSVSGISAPVTLTAGQSATFNVSFTPLTSGAKSGSVTVSSNASNPTLTIPLSGTGTSPGTLVSNPTTLSFGNVPVSTTQALSETLTNVGGTTSTISSLTASGAGFSVSGITAPVTLTPGQSATFSVSFTPASAGAVNGDVTIISDASDSTFVVPLSGTGTGGATGQLTVAPTTLGLGSVVVGSSGTATGSLTASGASVTVIAASSSSGAFSLSGLSLPVTIPAGQSASFTVTFSPQATGAASATLTFTSNAQPTTTTENLTGTGTPAATHSVDLSWDASTTTDVSGYNIYRAVYTTSCGSFSKINSSLNAAMSYTDPSVSSGTSYCYAATAVDSNDMESAYSNIVSNLQIP